MAHLPNFAKIARRNPTASCGNRCTPYRDCQRLFLSPYFVEICSARLAVRCMVDQRVWQFAIQIVPRLPKIFSSYSDCQTNFLSYRELPISLTNSLANCTKPVLLTTFTTSPIGKNLPRSQYDFFMFAVEFCRATLARFGKCANEIYIIKWGFQKIPEPKEKMCKMLDIDANLSLGLFYQKIT